MRYLWLLLLVSCVKLSEQPDVTPSPAPRPTLKFDDTLTMDFFEKSKKMWTLHTLYLERWENKQMIFARPIEVVLYDSTGLQMALLQSDSGILDLNMNYVRAYGKVFAISPKKASVRASDSLVWDKYNNSIHTESNVRVVTEKGDVLQGKGFKSNSKFEDWQILGNVTGIFQDMENRLDSMDAAGDTVP